MERIIDILKKIGIPYAHSQFAEGEAVPPPFICYLTPGDTAFSADGVVYSKSHQVKIELYTDGKSPYDEGRVEAVLDAEKLYYEKSEFGIESEKLTMVVYDFEILHKEER